MSFQSMIDSLYAIEMSLNRPQSVRTSYPSDYMLSASSLSNNNDYSISLLSNNEGGVNEESGCVNFLVPEQDEDVVIDNLVIETTLSNYNMNTINDHNENVNTNEDDDHDTSTVNSNEIELEDDIDINNINNNNNDYNSKCSVNNKQQINPNFSNDSEYNTQHTITTSLFNNTCYNIKHLSNSMMLIPYNKLNRFKQTSQYKLLEVCFYLNIKLNLFKSSHNKYDFESENAVNICKELFSQIEQLYTSFNITMSPRTYRNKFTQTYLSLYEDNTYGYFTEILDNAQEAIPYLVVNGEKFIFSKAVIEHGHQLITAFTSLLQSINDIITISYEEVSYDSINDLVNDVVSNLINFDKKWVTYEEKYINGLIYIDKVSRRYIYQCIQIEKEMKAMEVKASIKGKINIINDKQYNKLRERYVKALNEINKIANINGKGRDDLTIDILLQSETVLQTVSEIKSKGMRKLATKIKSIFNSFRTLFMKYNSDIDSVDPQLANNKELVELLYEFECLWEKGKNYFINKINYKHLLLFNQIVEIIGEKYPQEQIRNLIEQSDPIIFVTIPAVLILRAVDSGNCEIIQQYIPDLLDECEENGKMFKCISNDVKEVYMKTKDSYVGYNLFERFILFEGTWKEKEAMKCIEKYIDKERLVEFKKMIKMLSMNMQRFKPQEWNELFQLAMEIS